MRLPGVKPQDRSTLSCVVDGALLLLLSALAGIGMLLAFVLLPGRDLHESHGRGVHLTLWGWDRHDWGELHLVLSLLFLLLALIHVALHYKQILCWLRRFVPSRLGRAAVVGTFGVLGLVALGLFLVVTPDVERGGHGRRSGPGWHRGGPKVRTATDRPRGCRRAPDRTGCSRGPRWRAP